MECCKECKKIICYKCQSPIEKDAFDDENDFEPWCPQCAIKWLVKEIDTLSRNLFLKRIELRELKEKLEEKKF
jgi:DNA-directed RNA polymerase subunit RPC12/RpoP